MLLRVPIARRTRLAVDLADSQGSAGTAATAQADFNIQRDITSFATMRFTGAADVAAGTVLEPGDVFSAIVASSTEATLANV